MRVVGAPLLVSTPPGGESAASARASPRATKTRDGASAPSSSCTAGSSSADTINRLGELVASACDNRDPRRFELINDVVTPTLACANKSERASSSARSVSGEAPEPGIETVRGKTRTRPRQISTNCGQFSIIRAATSCGRKPCAFDAQCAIWFATASASA